MLPIVAVRPKLTLGVSQVAVGVRDGRANLYDVSFHLLTVSLYTLLLFWGLRCRGGQPEQSVGVTTIRRFHGISDLSRSFILCYAL